MAYMKRHRGRRGVSTVEAALVMIWLLILTFATFEYGWLFLKAQQVANAARHGARTGAVVGGTGGEAENAARLLLQSAGLSDNGDDVTIVPPDLEDLAAGETFTVSVSVETADLSLTGFPLPMPGTISSSVSMVKEGQ